MMKVTFKGENTAALVWEIGVFLDELEKYGSTGETPAPVKVKEDKPKGRRKAAPEKQEEPEAKPSSRRKGRAEPVEKEEGGITDADLSKAASEAAMAVPPDAVKEIISQFGVEDMRKLDQGQRREFLDLLKDAVKE